MKHETYVSFVRQMTPIWEDCKADKEVAKKNPKRYTTYQMKTPSINKMVVCYDNQKVKSHIEELRKICKMVPQTKVDLSLYVISVGQLMDDNIKQMTDLSKRRKKASQDASLIELFFSMCVTCGIMYVVSQDPAEPSIVYGGMEERICSQYQE